MPLCLAHSGRCLGGLGGSSDEGVDCASGLGVLERFRSWAICGAAWGMEMLDVKGTYGVFELEIRLWYVFTFIRRGCVGILEMYLPARRELRKG